MNSLYQGPSLWKSFDDYIAEYFIIIILFVIGVIILIFMIEKEKRWKE